MSDVRVLGLVMGTHVLEDIRIDIPHGVTVTIPAEMAARSKDLHRAIGQKCVFVLPATMGISHVHQSPPSPPPPAPSLPPVVAPVVVKDLALHERIRALELENRRLQTSLQTSSEAAEKKLDAILLAIQSGAVGRAVNGRIGLPDEVASGGAPTFIPSEIRPKDAESRIETQKDSAGASGVADAAERLRKIRQGNQ